MKSNTGVYSRNIFAANLVLCLCFGISSYAQIITTFAGTGISGFTGDGGPATMAEITQGSHIATDVSGNLYILGSDHRLRKVNTAGIISTIAGTGASCIDGAGTGNGGAATLANLDIGSVGLAVDAMNNIYIASSADVRMINASGIITNFAGAGYGGFFGGDGGQATAALLSNVTGIVADRTGNIFIADRGNNRVRKIDATGIITTIAGNGTLGYTGDGSAATNAEILANSLAIDVAGNLYVSCNYGIRKISTSGIITTYAGTNISGFSGDGGPATAAQFEVIWGIKMDTSGNLFICDDNRIRKINASSFISTIAGTGIAGFSGDGGPATVCEFHVANSIATLWNSCGEHIFISEQDNNNIREIINYNHPPLFNSGHTQTLNLCQDTGAININTLLAITDSDSGQPESWWVTRPTSHGTLTASYSAVSSGGIITPAGLTYTPATGYSGTDTFRVKVIDCGNAPDSTTVYITVTPKPAASQISGLDTVCYHRTITLTDTATGGSWFATNTNAIVTAGTVQGEHFGLDTISYIVANGCGSTKVSKTVYVKDCTAGVGSQAAYEAISIYPNPNDGSFTISFPPNNIEHTTITITNMLGQKVKEISTNTNEQVRLHIDAGAGVYFISSVSAAGFWSSKVVIR